MSEKTVLVGTYTDSGSKGIYSFKFQDGELSSPELFANINSPKYLSVEDGLVASIGKFDRGAGAAVFNPVGELISSCSYENKTSCYVTWHNGKVYTANYHEGTFSVLSFENNELKLLKKVEIKDGAGAHQVLFHGDKVLVPCLFLDRIMIFDEELSYVGSINFPDGTGPRHGVFSSDGTLLYLVSELSNELYVLDTEDWKMRSVLPVLPDGETYVRGTAAVRLSEDNDKLYVSTRGQDIISVIDLKQMKVIQGAYSGGKHPRDFILLDHHVISGNRYSDTVVSFKLREDGTIGEETERITIPQAVSFALLEINED
ncbi:MAG: beta-propeller fold lactonase family protein [Solobacterium sp.]|nr:beta-propeller fold lactonase family protein [Solobacterium sp.]